MAQGFPVLIQDDNLIDIIKRRKESRWMQSFCQTSAGNMNLVSQGSVGIQDWMTRTPATIGSNLAIPMGSLVVPAGRTYVITDITGYVTGNCSIFFSLLRRVDNSINGTSGTISLDGMLDGKTTVIKETDGGNYSFKFDSPLVLNPGEQLVGYYYRASTTGINWIVNFGAMDFTFDTNYSATKKMLVLGDSIGGVTSDAGSLSKGLWPVIIRDKYLDLGKDIRLINISQGGTTSNDWNWWVDQGRIDGIEANILFINLGMNDHTNLINITNNTTKNALKNITARYLRYNPRGKVVINSISPTNGGTQANLPIFRSAILDSVNEMKALGQQVYFADTSLAFPQSEVNNYVATEQGASNGVHPNTTLGQPKMANIIWEVCKDLI